MKKRILFIFGTRPEAIKMAPLVIELKKYPDDFQVLVCVTAQHREMLDQVLNFFSITPDVDLDIMMKGQTLFDITTKGLKKLESVLKELQPHLVLIQGDTTTAFIGALAAFYQKIEVGHIEAGLRSFNKYSPYPEEINRKMIGVLTDYHFAPTINALQNLQAEKTTGQIEIVGNTVIDALLLGLDLIKQKKQEEKNRSYFGKVNFNKKVILVTSHRRESFGDPFINICSALRRLAEEFMTEVEIVYPVHLNPNIQEPVNKYLSNLNNVTLLEPLDYPQLIWLMEKSHFILTDSGGIQEEAPALGKPVVVLRDVTERTEGIEAGTAILAGTDANKIFEISSRLLKDHDFYDQMAKAVNPYGDGTSCKKIADFLRRS